jgi:hypothetical protein
MTTTMSDIVSIYDETKKLNPDFHQIGLWAKEMMQTWDRTNGAIPDATDLTNMQNRMDVNGVYVQNTSGGTVVVTHSGKIFSCPNNIVWHVHPGEYSHMLYLHPGKFTLTNRAAFEGANGQVQVFVER